MKWNTLIIPCCLFLLPNVLYAKELSFENAPREVEADAEFTVDVSFIGDPQYYHEKTYYLRAVFAEPDSNKYFGFTQNHNTNWINTSDDKSLFLTFTTNSEGSWSGQLKVKADIDHAYFKGQGEYSFKIGRYTSATDSSADWSANSETILIKYTPPSPTPSNTPTPNPPTPTKKTSSKKSEQTEQSEQEETKPSPTSAQVLGLKVVEDFLDVEASSSATLSAQHKHATVAGIIDMTQQAYEASQSSNPITNKSKPTTKPYILIVGLILSLAASSPFLKYMIQNTGFFPYND